MGELGSDLVESQCGEETDDAIGNPAGRLYQCDVGGVIPVGEEVDAASGSLKDAGVTEPAQELWVNIVLNEVPHAQKALFAGEAEDFLGRGGLGIHVHKYRLLLAKVELFTKSVPLNAVGPSQSH